MAGTRGREGAREPRPLTAKRLGATVGNAGHCLDVEPPGTKHVEIWEQCGVRLGTFCFPPGYSGDDVYYSW